MGTFYCKFVRVTCMLTETTLQTTFYVGHISVPLLFQLRGVPAYTQSTQLRTLIFECPKNINVLNREKCNKNMPHPG